MIVNKLDLFHKKFRSDFQSFLKPLPGNIEVNSKELMSMHPLTYAIFGSIARFFEMSKQLNYTFDLTEQLRTVTLIDLDKLQAGSRLAEELVFTYSSFGREMYKMMQDDPDLIIAKAQTMKFGRALMVNHGELGKAMPNLKLGKYYT